MTEFACGDETLRGQCVGGCDVGAAKECGERVVRLVWVSGEVGWRTEPSSSSATHRAWSELSETVDVGMESSSRTIRLRAVYGHWCGVACSISGGSTNIMETRTDESSTARQTQLYA